MNRAPPYLVCSIIGGWINRVVYQQHFKKARKKEKRAARCRGFPVIEQMNSPLLCCTLRHWQAQPQPLPVEAESYRNAL